MTGPFELAEFHQLEGEPVRVGDNHRLDYLVRNLASALRWHGLEYVAEPHSGDPIKHVDLRRFRNVCAAFVAEWDKRIEAAAEPVGEQT